MAVSAASAEEGLAQEVGAFQQTMRALHSGGPITTGTPMGVAFVESHGFAFGRGCRVGILAFAVTHDANFAQA